MARRKASSNEVGDIVYDDGTTQPIHENELFYAWVIRLGTTAFVLATEAGLRVRREGLPDAHGNRRVIDVIPYDNSQILGGLGLRVYGDDLDQNAPDTWPEGEYYPRKSTP